MKNIIESWISYDKCISGILRSIDVSTSDENAAAEKTFHEVGNYLKIPLQEEDITDEIYRKHDELGIEPRSVFNELAIINYLVPYGDIRGNVMLALYNVYNKKYIDSDEAANIHFGNKKKIPDEYSMYFFGNTIDAKLSFSLPAGLTWIEAGAKCVGKVIRL